MIPVEEIVALHRDMVVRWHELEDVDYPYEGVKGVICRQHAFNYLLWHEEDVARSPSVGDHRVAQVKRAIDRYNQLRNDWIEKIDDLLTAELCQRQVETSAQLPLNSETPGSVIDRLSILALRIYHMEQQAQRMDATQQHIQSVQHKLAICLSQLDDLADSLRQLLDDILAGRKRHKTYRQLKMYNDPTLNPYLYEAQKRTAG